MNKEKIDAACELIAQFGDRPEMVRAMVTVIWWEGHEQGRRIENAMILRSLAQVKTIIKNIQAEGDGTAESMKYFDKSGPVESGL